MATRREFLGHTLGGVAAAALPVWLAGHGARRADAATPPITTESGESECVVFDFRSRCGIRESSAGYESALSSLDATWSRSTDSVRRYPALIVAPAATGFGPAGAAWLGMQALAGSTVLLELASAWADDESAFDADREALRQLMGIELGRPVNLWPRRTRAMPYVDYDWPSPASVRDFSRVLPMTVRDGEAIGHVGDMPVAVRCRKDLGTIVVLGSPLGPALLSGDAEARRWLGEVVAGSRARMAAYEAHQREIMAAGSGRRC